MCVFWSDQHMKTQQAKLSSTNIFYLLSEYIQTFEIVIQHVLFHLQIFTTSFGIHGSL